MIKTLERFTVPTRYDLAQYGTLCFVKEDGKISYYIQKSQDPTVADWERMGLLLERIFYPHILDDIFLKECLLQDSLDKKDLIMLANLLRLK